MKLQYIGRKQAGYGMTDRDTIPPGLQNAGRQALYSDGT